MTDLKNHWGLVREQWRHIPASMDDNKKNRIIYNFNQYMFPVINWNNVYVGLDWGCGGGVLTKELKKIVHKVFVADICEDSLNKCQQYACPDKKIVIPGDLSEFKYRLESPDFILAHAIVWHFPSLTYFKKVLDIWASLAPDYIALNTKKIEKECVETANYKRNFLNALLMGDKLVISLFKERGYDLKLSNVVTTGLQPQTYFVFYRT